MKKRKMVTTKTNWEGEWSNSDPDTLDRKARWFAPTGRKLRMIKSAWKVALALALTISR